MILNISMRHWLDFSWFLQFSKKALCLFGSGGGTWRRILCEWNCVRIVGSEALLFHQSTLSGFPPSRASWQSAVCFWFFAMTFMHFQTHPVKYWNVVVENMSQWDAQISQPSFVLSVVKLLGPSSVKIPYKINHVGQYTIPYSSCGANKLVFELSFEDTLQ